MIKVNKDLSKIPDSLQSKKTNEKRSMLLVAKKYDKKYNRAYKEIDIKQALLKIYHKKCCYCEQNVADIFFTIEHYRPKAIYYWLAFSWDNLLLCCDRCNTFKNKTFTCKNKPVTLELCDLNDIHTRAKYYAKKEKPNLIHPELEDISAKLTFTKQGEIKSTDDRVDYTIKACRLDREEANEKRKKVFDDFLKKYQSKMYSYQKSKTAINKGKIFGIIDDFKQDATNKQHEYIIFRRYIVKNLRDFL